jgi:hypothetical protein
MRAFGVLRLMIWWLKCTIWAWARATRAGSLAVSRMLEGSSPAETPDEWRGKWIQL